MARGKDFFSYIRGMDEKWKIGSIEERWMGEIDKGIREETEKVFKGKW